MRITRTEKGNLHGKYYVTPYVRVYTQPLSRFVIAWLYHHVWEKLSWRIVRVAENLREKYGPEHKEFYIPYTNRQDIRCYHLRYKGQIVVSQTLGEPIELPPNA